jgi:hypothetical protein
VCEQGRLREDEKRRRDAERGVDDQQASYRSCVSQQAWIQGAQPGTSISLESREDVLASGRGGQGWLTHTGTGF